MQYKIGKYKHIGGHMEIEHEIRAVINDSKSMDSDSSNSRAKTSLRLLYEAKARLIRKQLGGLSGIQQELHLSQRKLAQLLMVDPSTWNRWSKNEDLIPPHVWNSLQWYLALQEKVPGLTPQYFLGFNDQVFQERLDGLKLILKEELLSELQMSPPAPAPQIGEGPRSLWPKISHPFLLGCTVGIILVFLALRIKDLF